MNKLSHFAILFLVIFFACNYNGIDDDCNTSTLDDDLDRDGFLRRDDCIDTNPKINPGVAEIPYNGIDDDCNTSTPDDDLDGDGFLHITDCDDEDPTVFPNQEVEVPYNGIDDDCNLLTLDDDFDQDGFLLVDDCNDNDAEIHPDIEEISYNGIDDDCNPLTLDDDLDGDGYNHTEDCNDRDPLVNPDADTSADYDCENRISWTELQNRRCHCWKKTPPTREEILDNLIGHWELLAIQPGWGGETYYQCITLEIKPDLIIIENLDKVEVDTVTWQLETTERETFTYSRMVLDNEEWDDKVGMSTFCDNLLFGSGGWIDADVYYYEKL